jgi:carboxylate-amine ligase
VHVGCQNGDDAIYLLHGLSRFVRIYRAECGLAVARRDRQRFACSRLNLFAAYPDNGPMPWVNSWQEFTRLFRR